tara:strand:+ start:3640 stop:3882 length:243 start_codon:yes stop_codon:yes gene_type:complete
VPLFDVVVDAKGDAKRDDDDDDVKTNVSPSFFTLSLLFRVFDTLNMTCSIFFSPLKKYARFLNEDTFFWTMEEEEEDQWL